MKRFLILTLALAAGLPVVAATNIPWRLPAYTLTARQMSVRQALDAFGVAQGVPVIQSDAVQGAFSGNFENVPADVFLDRLTMMHNLMWYYDGASLFVSGAGESLTTLIDLQYMKADEVVAMMRELGVEDARFPLKTASNGELIMVSGPPRYVRLVAEMIGKADRLRERRTFAEVETRIFRLKNTWADTVSLSVSGNESSPSIKGVAQLLQELMSAGSGGRFREGTNVTGRATAAEKASAGYSQPMIRPENRLNAVIIRDVTQHMPMYERLIAELDVPQKLVEITVTVLEMSRGDALDWEASLKVGFNDGNHTAWLGQNTDSLAEEAADAALAGLTGGYSYLGDRVNVSASIYALKEKGKARTIARTSLLTLNNLAAEVSDTQSYNSKLVGEKVASVSETSAETSLSVKPRIVDPPAGMTNSLPQVWLTMQLKDGGFDFDETVDGMPTKSTTTVETQAALPENHSLLIAGNFRDVDTESTWGIPVLRDIPWIGWLFGGVTTTKSTLQRLFILTPHIIDMPRFSAASTNDLVEVRLLANRDTSREEVYTDIADRDDLIRTEREAKAKEQQEIFHEKYDEEHERNEAERDFRRQLRQIDRETSHAVWQKEFEERKKAVK